MEVTQMTKGEDSHNSKNTIQQEVLSPRKKIMKNIAFRFHRFTGTAKHKSKLFYNLKYLSYRDEAINKCKKVGCFIGNHTRRFAIVGSAIVVMGTGIFLYDANVGYKVTFNGQELGIVREQETFTEAVTTVKKELSERYSTNIVFDKEIEFEKTVIDKDKLLVDVNDNVKAIYSTGLDLSIDGAVLIIEGEEVANFTSVEEAQKAFDGALEPYVKETSSSKLIGEPKISEEYSIVEKKVSFGDTMEVEKAIELISKGTDELKQYKVKKGDTSWDIAVNRGVKIKDLEKANPNVDIEDLHDGDVINLTAIKPYLTVETVKEEISEEKIKYNIDYKNDSSIYKGKTKVISEGESGIKEITSQVTYRNGKIVSNEVIDEEVTKAPVNQVVAKGTKPIPLGAGTGQFSLPTSGRISAIDKSGSHAGSRAVDIANSIGTPIYAADSGRVIKASNSGNGYGNHIIIDHGNGYQTLYGHLSSYNVKVGQSVSKGQKIAGMGSTGRSTGSHLHFEVIKNGARQKITDYFNLSKRGYVSR